MPAMSAFIYESRDALGRAELGPARLGGEIWERAITEEGINDELRPILRMTMPPGLRGKTVDDVEVGVPLGRSWILLGGLLPVDYDDLCLAELEPGRRFLERSAPLSFSVWQHERVVEPEDGGLPSHRPARVRAQGAAARGCPGPRGSPRDRRVPLPPPPPATGVALGLVRLVRRVRRRA